jgi:rhodanese-related sulfurtransferase
MKAGFIALFLAIAALGRAIEPSLSSSSDLLEPKPAAQAPVPIINGQRAFGPVPTPMPAVTPFKVHGVTPDPNYKPDPQFSAWPHIDLDEAKRLKGVPGTLFVDARAEVEWEQGHLPGAIPLPAGEFEKYYAKYKSKIKKAKVLIPYCHGAGCHLSDKTCQQLVGKGFKNVVGFFGGEPKWREAKLPMYDKSGKKIQ